MRDCYDNVQLSFDQVRIRHFPECKRPTIQNRITKLKKAKLIRSQRVGVVIYQGKQKHIGVVYQLTGTGLAVLRDCDPQDRFREKPLLINTVSLPHDLALTDVIDRLRGYLPEHEIVHGRVHFGAPPEQSRVPDAIAMRVSDRKHDVAIELEYTAKSDKRYRQIITQYRINSQYTKIIYVCSSHAIAAKIKAVITGLKRPLRGTNQVTSKFYFVTLDELLRGQAPVVISNGNENLLGPQGQNKIDKGEFK